MRALLFAAFLGVATLLMTVPTAQAHSWPYYQPYRSYYYYGGGGHDYVPHWHRTDTPFGSFYWYGRGLHDDLPHHHTITPFGYRGYSYGPWWRTKSYYPRYPYAYYPW